MGDPYGCNCDIEFRRLEREHKEALKVARAEGFEQGVKEMTAVMGSDQTDVVKAVRKAYDRDLDAMKKVLEKEAEVKVSKARAEVKWAESRLHANRAEGYAQGMREGGKLVSLLLEAIGQSYGVSITPLVNYEGTKAVEIRCESRAGNGHLVGDILRPGEVVKGLLRVLAQFDTEGLREK